MNDAEFIWLGDGEFIGTCLDCGVPVYEQDDYGRDTDGNVYCEECTGDVPF